MITKIVCIIDGGLIKCVYPVTKLSALLHKEEGSDYILIASDNPITVLTETNVRKALIADVNKQMAGLRRQYVTLVNTREDLETQ